MSWAAIDLGRAAFALGLALVLYLFAINETNPETTRQTDFSVPVEVVNVQPGLVVMDKPPAVQLRVRAPLDVFNRLRQESFVAQVDASSGRAGQNDLLVLARAIDPGVREVIVLPPRVPLALEEIQERSLVVRINPVGQVPTGYQPGQARVDPARVSVSGPSSLVRRAVEAVVDVNVDRVTVSVNGAFTPRVVDERQNDIREIAPRPSVVNVEIPISQQAQFKEVGVKPVIQGQPAPGYLPEPVELNPPTTTLVGDVSSLEGTNFVETEPIDVSGVTSTVVRRVRLMPPRNTLLLQQDQTVLVTVRVTPLNVTQTVRVVPSVLDVPPGTELARQPEPVAVTISGPAPTLASLNARDFRVTLTLTGQAPGSQEVEAKVDNLPAGMQVVRIDPSRVTVQLREAEPVGALVGRRP